MALKKNLNANEYHGKNAFGGTVIDPDTVIAASTPVLSKVKIGEQTYWLKDADARKVVDIIYADYLKASDKAALEAEISAEEAARIVADGDLQALIDALEAVVGDENSGLVKGLADEIKRATEAEEALDAKITAEAERADAAEKVNAAAIAAEQSRAEGKEAELATAISAEETRAKGVEEDLQDQIDDIEEGLVKVKSGEKILGLDGTTKELSTTLAINYDSETRKVQLKGINNELVSEFDASAFIKDGMLYGEKAFVATATSETVEIKGQTHTFDNLTVGHQYLAFVFTDGAVPTATYTWEIVDLQDLVDVYTAGNGIDITNNVVSAVAKSGDKYIEVTADGIASKGIDTAIADAVADEAEIARAAEQANAQAISAEETRAKAAEKANADAIDALEGRMDTAEGDIEALEGRMDTAEDEIDALQADSHTHANKAELDLIASGDKAKWDKAVTDLASEIARATKAEEDLDDKIDGVASGLADEITRATEAEEALDTAYKAADATLDGKITDEATAREDADDAINAKIGAKTDAATADTVYGAINAETARAEAAEADLQEQIDDLDEGAFKNVEWVDMGRQLTKTIGDDTTVVHEFGDLADENLANLEVKGQTISGVKATGTSTGELTGALNYTSTEIASNGTFTATGSIDVTLAGNTFDAITSVGELAKYTPENVTGGKATVVDTTKFNGGSQASFTQGAKANLTTSNISYVEEGVNVEVGTGDDSECLIFTNLTAKSAKAVDTFTANGDDNFTANTVASLGDGFVTAGSDVSYTPSQYTDAVLPTKAAQTVSVATKSFTGTANQPISVAGNYDKANLGTVAFSGKAIELNVGDIVVADKDVTKKA